MEFQVTTYTGDYIRKTRNHLYIAPSQELKSVVAHYTITFQNPQYPIPSGRVLNLIPDVSGCFVFKFHNHLSIKVWGPTTKVVTVHNDLNTFPCRFFVEFLPTGLSRILGINGHEILDQKIELEDLYASLYNEIEQQISQMTTFDEIVSFIDQLLCREMKKHQVPSIVYDCLKMIEDTHGRISIQSLTVQLHKSERQLNRYFHHYVGMSMKKYSQIVNINHLIQDISEKKLLDLTYDYAYFDQAHFNHVFKQICETTPTHYLENLSDFYNELYKFSL